MFELKPLSPAAIPAALAKAERYRFLNEPAEAESICLDILELDPENQLALVTLLLALTDQFESAPQAHFERASEIVSRLKGGYEQAYYQGIIAERRAKAYLRKDTPVSGAYAYDGFRAAMDCFERAAAARPAGNDDAILRWNTCVRILASHPRLEPRPEDPGEPLLLE